MIWIIKVLSWFRLNWLLPSLTLNRQLAAIEEEIHSARGPGDGVGALEALTVVIINRAFLQNWKTHIPEEAVLRFGSPQEWMKVLAWEAELQSTPYKLDARDLAAFRRGLPIIKKTMAFKERADLGKGGRELDVAEARLRGALEHEVYIRTEQARGLLERQTTIQYSVPQARKAVWHLMGDRVGYDRKADLPRLKLRKQDGDEALNPEELARHRRLRTFELLFKEGAKVAAKRVSGAKRPGDVGAIALGSGRRTTGNPGEELEVVLAHVIVLYRACYALSRRVSFLYRLSSWLRGGLLHRRKNQVQQAPRQLRAGHHRVLTAGDFRPAELLLIASHADVNPLLIDNRHLGCATEFHIARKFGRFVRGSNERLNEQEVQALHEAMFVRCGRPNSDREATQDDLRTLALEVFPLDKWDEVLSQALSSGEGIQLYRQDHDVNLS